MKEAAQEASRYLSWPCWHGDSKESRCSSTTGLLATALGSHRYGSAVKTHKHNQSSKRITVGFLLAEAPFHSFSIQECNIKTDSIF